MRKYALIALLLVMATSVFVACSKKKGDDPIPVEEEHVPDFTISGHPYIQETLNFVSNYNNKQTMTWNFGDGTQITISGTRMEHVYDAPGSYSITMSLDGTDKVVTKSLRITSGAERVEGSHRWNYFLKLDKKGFPQNHIKPIQFDMQMEVQIPNDTTIVIPNIPNMRFPGPYTVTLQEVTKEHMVFKSTDELTELSYNFSNQRGGIKIVQVSNDTTWSLDGFADIYN